MIVDGQNGSLVTVNTTLPGDVYHGQEILARYARVGVEQVSNDWKTVELDIPGGDREMTLVEAIHDYILWDKRYIIIKATEQASRPASPQRAPSTSPPSPQAVHRLPLHRRLLVHLLLHRQRSENRLRVHKQRLRSLQ